MSLDTEGECPSTSNIPLNVFQDRINAIIPNEVLTIIFRHSASELHGCPFPITLSHVCHRWREITLNTASLWTLIFIYDRLCTESLQVQLSRSKCLPLEIHLVQPTKARVLDYFVRIKAVQARLREAIHTVHRWHSMSIQSSTRDAAVEVFDALHGLRAPLLQRFDVFLEPDGLNRATVFRETRRILIRGAPLLKSVSLDGVILLECQPPLSDLTNLTLDFADFVMPFELFRHALNETKHLETLRLVSPRFCDRPMDAELCIPSISHLTIKFAETDDTRHDLVDYWTPLLAPRLRSVMIIFNDKHWTTFSLVTDTPFFGQVSDAGLVSIEQCKPHSSRSRSSSRSFFVLAPPVNRVG